MNFLARALSTGTRFIARAAPVARFIARETPGALNAVARFSTNPLTQQVANKLGGVAPTILSRLSGGASNALGAINLVPGIRRDVNAAVMGAQPVAKSLAQLMATARGGG